MRKQILIIFIAFTGFFSCSKDGSLEQGQETMLSFNNIKEFENKVTDALILKYSNEKEGFESMASFFEESKLELDKLLEKDNVTWEEINIFKEENNQYFLYNEKDSSDFTLYLRCEPYYAHFLNKEGNVLINGEIKNYNKFNSYTEYDDFLKKHQVTLIPKDLINLIDSPTTKAYTTYINECRTVTKDRKLWVYAYCIYAANWGGDLVGFRAHTQRSFNILGIKGWKKYSTTFQWSFTEIYVLYKNSAVARDLGLSGDTGAWYEEVSETSPTMFLRRKDTRVFGLLTVWTRGIKREETGSFYVIFDENGNPG